MSRTYRAELTPWRLHEIHPKYLERAQELNDMPARIRVKEQCYETLCPYCGERGLLTAKIRVGAKKLVENVPLTEHGYYIPNVRNRSTEILIIRCSGDHTHPVTGEIVDATLDPMAYMSPIVFVRDRMQARQIIES